MKLTILFFIFFFTLLKCFPDDKKQEAKKKVMLCLILVAELNEPSSNVRGTALGSSLCLINYANETK